MIRVQSGDKGLRLELHADDLGATPGVNRGIITAWKRGGVDGISALANGDALDEAAVEINRNLDRPLRIVAHLNLSEGRPMAPAAEIPLLVNADGQLHRGFLGLWLHWINSNSVARQELLDQVTLEWRAQINRIRDAFGPRKIDALDGHIHIHMLPFTFPAAVSLASESGIGQIRISNEVRHFSLKDSLRFHFLVNIIKHQLLRILARPARKLATDAGIKSPDAVAGLLYSGRMSRTAIETAAAAARRREYEWLEVICHPGRASPDEQRRWNGQPGLAGFYLSPDRDIEFQAMIELADTGPSSLLKKS